MQRSEQVLLTVSECVLADLFVLALVCFFWGPRLCGGVVSPVSFRRLVWLLSCGAACRLAFRPR